MQVQLSTNFFELFGLPQRYDVDASQLSTRYRDLQRVTHPDKFAQAAERERRESAQLSAHLNEAFQTLKDPIKRARYLLALRGVQTNEETDTVMDGTFLLQQMELREELEHARGATDRIARLEQLAVTLDKQRRDKQAQLQRALDDSTAASLEKARALVREMQFIAKLADEVNSLRDEN